MSDLTLKLPFVLGLFVITLVSILILFSIDSATKDQIQENRLAASRKIFNDIIPPDFTNDIFNDGYLDIEPAYFGTQKPVSINRIRINNEIVGVLIYPITANGYKSDIELGISMTRAGEIVGTRVLYEDETIGLGDQVHQDKSDWADVFNGKSLTGYTRDQWKVKSDGGVFDEISGATITSRSVINAVRSALDYHDLTSEMIYAEQ